MKNGPPEPARASRPGPSPPPKHPLGSGRKRGEPPAAACNATRIWEANPLEGVEPLEWFLPTEPFHPAFEAAIEKGPQYASRWIIEEFHMGLKTGGGAEQPQLEDEKVPDRKNPEDREFPNRDLPPAA